MIAPALLRPVPPAPHHLTAPEPLSVLESLCVQLQPRLVVEVGTFLGHGSSLVFGRAVRATGGQLLCVDNCAVDMQTRKGIHRPESHLHLLLANMAQHPDLARATLLRATSREAAGLFAGNACLVFIDAGHGEQEVAGDIAAWLPHVRPGGVLCGDDFQMPEVARAVTAAFPDVQTAVGRIWWVHR